MMLVKIDDCTALDILMTRLERWTDDPITTELFEKLYQNYIDSGVFDGVEFDPMVIVDNDYINNFDVITVDDFDNYDVENDDDERIYAATTDYSGKAFYLLCNC